MSSIPFNRGVNEELFYYWLGAFWRDKLCLSFENDTFTIREYDYGADEGEDVDKEYHFYHKPSGLKIQWYKYPFRSSASNMEITYDQFRAVLVDCRNSLEGRVVYDLYPKGYWWEVKS